MVSCIWRVFFEQLENENENPVYYFFNDESELEVTNEQAYDIVEVRFAI